MIFEWVIASLVAWVYAWISHHTPSKVHQKYLTTIAMMLCKCSHSRTVYIGFHAVFVGSQSSLHLENIGSTNVFQKWYSRICVHSLQA